MSDGVARVDLHCHSAASLDSGTPPERVYELAKKRGMDFVTLTDHDTIAGALSLASHPDAFISEELTAWFRGQPQVVHVLCYGLTPDEHEWLQAHRGDVGACAEYLHDHERACALAHPFWNVAAPLTPAHRLVLAELFPVWETRNGKRGAELNDPAAVYVETRGGVAVAGSDDHIGVEIGHTYTEAPRAATAAEFLAHVRAGRVSVDGKQGTELNLFKLLHVGDLDRLELLVEAFLIASDRNPQLHLVIVGEGPAEAMIRRRLGACATFLDGDPPYADADLLVCATADERHAGTILEAHAAGLPVLAVEGAGPDELIEPGRSGCLVPADPELLASALRVLARRGAVRQRLVTGGLSAARERARSVARVA
jgi:predicted metal-dependent phosphoesterase TrpH